MKTRAAQLLEQAKIPYEIREFQEEELGAEEAARKLQIPLAQVFKTLVVRGDRTGVILAWLILGERLTAIQLVGGLLAVGGVLACQRPASPAIARDSIRRRRFRPWASHKDDTQS